MHITGYAKEKAFCRWGDRSITVIREAKARSLTTEEKHLEYLIFQYHFIKEGKSCFHREVVKSESLPNLQLGTVCQVDWNKLGLINNNKNCIISTYQLYWQSCSHHALLIKHD